MNLSRYLPLTAALAMAASAPVFAATYSVGPTPSCTHATLQAALNQAAANPVGPHLVKIRSGLVLTDTVTINFPAADIRIEGSYADCSSGAPTATTTTTISPNSSRVFDMDGGSPSAVARRTITLTKLKVSGGNVPINQIGGGIRVSGKLELRLARGAEVVDNSASDGGGIGLMSVASAPSDMPRLLVDEDARISDNLAGRWGGGVYAVGAANVTLLHGRVTGNTARRGGGIYLAGSNTDLRIQTFDTNRVAIDDNVAGGATFSATDGFGGAIYSQRARVLADATGSPGQHTISLSGNTANHGGAIYAEGPTDGSYSFIELRDSVVLGNYARGKGGAFYSRYAVEWLLSHDSTGPCAVLLIGLVPCSFVMANAAGNETTPDTSGGGVFFLASDTGIPRSIARIRRTLFQGNEDVNGRAAIIEAQGANEYLIDRSLFKGNAATGGGGQFATLFRSGTGNTRVMYSTVLGNDVDRLFVFGGTTLTVTGSIFWAPGTTIWMQPATAMVHGTCLITHSTVNIPAGASVLDPKLDAAGRPRNGSDAWDFCEAPALADLYGYAAYDIPGVDNAHGIYDLGAYEQFDIIFTHGIGPYPRN